MIGAGHLGTPGIAARGRWPTYTAFRAYVMSLAVPSIPINSSLSSGDRYAVMDAQPAGTMWGSSWGRLHTTDSTMGRRIQHAMPDIDTFNATINNAAVVLMRVVAYGQGSSFASLNRNGYTSSSYGGFPASYMSRFVYWDFSRGAAFEINPYGATAPVPFRGW